MREIQQSRTKHLGGGASSRGGRLGDTLRFGCAAGLGGGGAFNGAHVWVRQGEMMYGFSLEHLTCLWDQWGTDTLICIYSPDVVLEIFLF